MSVNGDLLNSIISSISNRSVSISNKDIWQPKQPAKEVVATINFSSSFSSILLVLFKDVCTFWFKKSYLRSPKGFSLAIPFTRMAPTGHIFIACKTSLSLNLRSSL